MKIKDIMSTLWGKPDEGIAGEPDPDELTIDNAYKTRWIWYHTILGLELLIVILIQLAILVILAVKF